MVLMAYKTTLVDNEYLVVESGTDLTLFKSNNKDEARKVARSLNLGSGFNGFTPTFFTFDYSQIKKATTADE